jgi:hypothetical protein
MKTVRNTPDQLILQSVPWVFGLTFVVIIVVMIGGGLTGLIQGEYTRAVMMGVVAPLILCVLAAMFVERIDLILDRSRNQVEMRRATLLGRTKVVHALEHVQKVIVQTHISTGRNGTDNGPSHRIALVLSGGMDAGEHPLTEVFVGGDGAEKTALAINAWLSQDVDSSPPQA